MRDATKRWITSSMIGLMIGLNFIAASANAGMLSTQTYIHYQQQTYSQQRLLTALQSEDLQQQLLDMGVEPDAVTERVASLTNAEIAQLNQQLAEEPAGSGVVGVLLTVFIVFVITDALCATDIFSFVHCINK